MAQLPDDEAIAAQTAQQSGEHLDDAVAMLDEAAQYQSPSEPSMAMPPPQPPSFDEPNWGEEPQPRGPSVVQVQEVPAYRHDETTPLLGGGPTVHPSTLASMSDHLPSVETNNSPSHVGPLQAGLDRARTAVSSATERLRDNYQTFRAHVITEYQPAWRSFLERSGEQRQATAQWASDRYRGMTAGAMERFQAARASISKAFNKVNSRMHEAHQYINENYTQEQRNMGYLAICVSIFIFFLWIYAVFAMFVPSTNTTLPVNPRFPGREFERLPLPLQPLRPTPHLHPEPSHLCTTAECVMQSSSIIQGMNADVSPCVDFYAYSCGGWDESHLVNGNVRSTFDVQAAEAKKSVDAVITEPLSFNDVKGDVGASFELHRRMQVLYGACMNKTAINHAGVSPIRETLKSRVALYFPTTSAMFPSGKSIIHKDRFALAMNAVHAMGIDTLFRVTVAPSPDSPIRNVPVLIPIGHLGATRQQYEDARFAAVYRAVISQALSHVFGDSGLFSGRSFGRVALEVFEFEASLAKLTPEETELDYENSETLSLETLREIAPTVPWREFLDLRFGVAKPISRLKVDSVGAAVVVAGGSKYLESLSKLLDGTRPDVLDWYMLWRSVQTLGRFGDSFLSEILAPESVDRASFCKEIIRTELGDVVEHFYAARYHDSNSANFFAYIKGAFVDTLRSGFKTLGSTSMEALMKIERLSLSSGVVDARVDLNSIMTKYGSYNPQGLAFFEDALSARQIAVDSKLSLLSGPMSRAKLSNLAWHSSSDYNVQSNHIFLPIGLLSRPYFGKDVPAYVSFGATSSIFASEAANAIGTKGRFFDSRGIARDWMEFDESKRLVEAEQCHGASDYLSHARALAVAVEAWRRDLNSVGGGERNPILPGLDHLTNEQLLFVSYGARHCGEVGASRRVNAAIRSSPDFAKAFQCWPEAPMNPSQKCPLVV